MAALTDAFAGDVIRVEEFERRVELVHRAQTPGELLALVDDLPRGETRPAPAGRSSTAPWQTGGAPGASPVRRGNPVPDAHRQESNLIFSFLGGGSRTGPWVPARKNTAISILGGIELDFRECSLPPGVTDVWCFTTMGGIEIVVPPDVVVQSSGMGIMGGFEHIGEVTRAPDDAPIIRINGVAVMGGVEISVRYPGETAKEAKRRRRLERKEQRRLNRGG